MMHENGFTDVALQTVEINRSNSTREPLLAQNETITDRRDVADLFRLDARYPAPRPKMFSPGPRQRVANAFRKTWIRRVILLEQEYGLYPDSDGLTTSDAGEDNAQTPSNENTFELCPNPWTTLFVAENGGVHLCFLAEPVGNLYEAPLVEIWNSPKAVAKRLRMIQGNYMASGCSSNWCSWREGKAANPLTAGLAGRFSR